MTKRWTKSDGHVSASMSQTDACSRVCPSVQKRQTRESAEFDRHMDKYGKNPTLTRGTDKVSTTYLYGVPVPRARGVRKVGLGCARHLPSPVSGNRKSKIN